MDDVHEIIRNSWLFITHAGASSVYEGIYFGTPSICIPQDFDQPMNAKRVEELGVGLAIMEESKIEHELPKAFRKIVENKNHLITNIEKVRSSYKESNTADDVVEKISALFDPTFGEAEL